MNKENLNQNGEQPSDDPGKELIKPSKKGKKYISTNTEHNKNSTAKDPKLGSRHTTR
jgi:hypothetical protein